MKIKKIIAIEGLILLGLAIVVYLFTIFLQNVPVVLPKYRLEFANGEARTITINPEIRNDSNYRRLLGEAYNPSPKLIEKRVKEFIRAGDIQSPLKSSTYINPKQVYISKLYSDFLSVIFILKLAIAYLILLLFRFITWAMRTLREK